MLQPNTLCRNPNCKKGVDGGRNFYYSCKYCAHEASWRAVACCIECLNEYTSIIENDRANNNPVDTTPVRTDMSKEQYNELIKRPVDEVRAETVKEITDAGYGETLQEIGLGNTLDKINEDIRKDKSSLNVAATGNKRSKILKPD